MLSSFFSSSSLINIFDGIQYMLLENHYICEKKASELECLELGTVELILSSTQVNAIPVWVNCILLKG